MLQLNSTGHEACYVIRLLYFIHRLYFIIIICFVHLTVKLSEGFFFALSVRELVLYSSSHLEAGVINIF